MSGNETKIALIEQRVETLEVKTVKMDNILEGENGLIAKSNRGEVHQKINKWLMVIVIGLLSTLLVQAINLTAKVSQALTEQENAVEQQKGK